MKIIFAVPPVFGTKNGTSYDCHYNVSIPFLGDTDIDISLYDGNGAQYNYSKPYEIISSVPVELDFNGTSFDVSGQSLLLEICRQERSEYRKMKKNYILVMTNKYGSANLHFTTFITIEYGRSCVLLFCVYFIYLSVFLMIKRIKSCKLSIKCRCALD